MPGLLHQICCLLALTFCQALPFFPLQPRRNPVIRDIGSGVKASPPPLLALHPSSTICNLGQSTELFHSGQISECGHKRRYPLCAMLICKWLTFCIHSDTWARLSSSYSWKIFLWTELCYTEGQTKPKSQTHFTITDSIGLCRIFKM